MLLSLAIGLSSLCNSNTMVAQQKLFTHDDLQDGGKTYQSMTPQESGAKWWGNTLVRITNDSCGTCCFNLRRNIGTVTAPSQLKCTKNLFTLNDINSIITHGYTDTLETLQDADFPYADIPVVMFVTSARRILINWELKKIVWSQQREEKSSAEDWNSLSRNLAFVKDNNLYVTDAKGKLRQLSHDGNRCLVYGQSVHRNEWGTSKGTFWSPDGMRLAYYRMDQSMVTDYPQVDISHRIAKYRPDKYPMAGMASHEVSIGIYNVEDEETVWLDLGEKKDRYFTGITWSPDNKTVYVTVINRDQNHDEIWGFSAETGCRLNKVYEESNGKYVHPEHPLLFLPWDENKFLYQTGNTGYSHLFLIDTKGNNLGDLTPGCHVVTSVLGFCPKSRSVIVATTGENALQHNLYAVNVATGKRQLLDNGEGVHSGTLSADGTMVLDTWSSPKVRRQYDVLSTSGKGLAGLFRPLDPWEGYAVPNITSGSLKAADGVTDLYYRLITPPDFDPDKKYPAIVYLYGGPMMRLVNASWGYNCRGWEIYMAQRGYVMFVMDNRGSSERGLAFENVTYRRLGEVEMADQMCGVNFLKSLPYIDADRLGVHGWSFGGFMTINLMVSYPEMFKVAVAGGPVIDWSLYEVMYGERYMSTPQKNPEGYRNSNLCLKAGNLKGRLKIIFGYNDPVCVPQHTLSFARACADAGTQIDLFAYPNGEHNMTGHDRIHLYEQITRYFNDFLR